MFKGFLVGSSEERVATASSKAAGDILELEQPQSLWPTALVLPSLLARVFDYTLQSPRIPVMEQARATPLRSSLPRWFVWSCPLPLSEWCGPDCGSADP